MLRSTSSGISLGFLFGSPASKPEEAGLPFGAADCGTFGTTFAKRSFSAETFFSVGPLSVLELIEVIGMVLVSAGFFKSAKETTLGFSGGWTGFGGDTTGTGFGRGR